MSIFGFSKNERVVVGIILLALIVAISANLLVSLRKARDMQRKSDEAIMNYDLKENQIEEQLDIEKMKLENNEDQAKKETKAESKTDSKASAKSPKKTNNKKD